MNNKAIDAVKRFLGYKQGTPEIRPTGFENVERSIGGPRLYQAPNAGTQISVDVSQVRITEKPDGKLEFSLDRNSLYRIDPYLHKATIKFDRVGEDVLLKAMIDSGSVQALLVGQAGRMDFKVRGVVDRTGENILDWEKHARGLTTAKIPEPSVEARTIMAALRFAQRNDAEFRQFAASQGFGQVDSGAQLERLAESMQAREKGRASQQRSESPIPPPRAREGRAASI